MAHFLDSFKDLKPPFEGAVKAAMFISSGWMLYWGRLGEDGWLCDENHGYLTDFSFIEELISPKELGEAGFHIKCFAVFVERDNRHEP
jgi:hypothetical protein